MKSTQLAYPTAQFFEGGTASRQPEPDKPNPENLPKLKLVASQKPEGRQLHHMRDGCVVLYKRDRSDVWQVRFKLFDMKWHCYSTKWYQVLLHNWLSTWSTRQGFSRSNGDAQVRLEFVLLSCFR